MRTIWRWIKANFIWFALTAFATAQDVEQWAEERVEELWRAIVTVIALPALFIITGLALGTFGVAWKATMIGIGLPIAIINLAILAWRHAVAGVALGVLIKWALREKFSFVGDTKKVIVEGIRFYAVDVLMGLLYTEIVIGMIAVATPAHEAPGYAYYAALAGLGLAVYAVRTGWGKNVWANIVKFVLVVTVVWSLLVIFFPPLRGFPTLVRNMVNEFFLNPSGAAAQTTFGIVAFLLLVSFVAPSLLKKEQEGIGKAVRVGARLAAVALLTYWFIWGPGYVKAKEWISESRPSAPYAAAAVNGLQRIEVALRPGETRRLDEWPNPLVTPGFSADFEVVKGNIFLSSGGGKPKPIEGKGVRFPWRSPMVLSGDGTVALLLYRH